MISEPIALVCTCEIAGRVRGKGFPVTDLSARLKSGVGWVPTNTMISALGPIADTAFGATGDLILVPDPATELKVDFEDGSVPEHFFLGDIRTTAGIAWECCPRDFLRRALAALKDVAGLELHSAFEQEFVYTGVEDHPGSPYSLESFRRQGSFGGALLAALRAAELKPDSFLPEYGARQYEVTTGPATGIAAADNAIKMREMARAVAHRLGHRAIFSPILDPDGTGYGVHIHMSLRTADSRPAAHDPARPYGLAPTAEAFMAGVLSHMRALVAVTAPNPTSYIRLTQSLGTDLGVSGRAGSGSEPARLSGARSAGLRSGPSVQHRIPSGGRHRKPLSGPRRNCVGRRRWHSQGPWPAAPAQRRRYAGRGAPGRRHR
jgi:glutamine synthetase